MLTKTDQVRVRGELIDVIIFASVNAIKNKLIVNLRGTSNGFNYSNSYNLRNDTKDIIKDFLKEFDEQYTLKEKVNQKLINQGFVELVIDEPVIEGGE